MHGPHGIPMPGRPPPMDKATARDHLQSGQPSTAPVKIKQRLLLYGVHSKTNHTHCLMALSSTAMAEVDSILEGTSRKIWHFPNTFPRAGLHAPPEDLELNIPTV